MKDDIKTQKVDKQTLVCKSIPYYVKSQEFLSKNTPFRLKKIPFFLWYPDRWYVPNLSNYDTTQSTGTFIRYQSTCHCQVALKSSKVIDYELCIQIAMYYQMCLLVIIIVNM